jgi:Xaa-Pro aminopeptidase
MEIAGKIKVVQEYLAERGAEGLHLRGVQNFAWITAGAKNYVTINGIQPECSILVTPEQATIVTPHSELHRLQATLPPDSFAMRAHDWDQDPAQVLAGLLNGNPVLEDTEPDTAAFLKSQRILLNENERERLLYLGREAAAALERGLEQTTPAMPESEAAARIASALMLRGIEPELVIVSGEANFRSHHNIPGQGEIGRICMGIVCAKWQGLVVSMTRMLAFGDDAVLAEQMRTTTTIDVAAIDATCRSATLDQAFSKLVGAYQRHGAPGEWRKLHQGGVVGYNLKEHFASLHSRVPILDGMAFAWNIAIQGTKSEDTYLLRDGAMHWVTKAADSTWPVLEHEVDGVAYHRPSIRCIKQISIRKTSDQLNPTIT